jgi:protein involved in polysaccharide export with SLBB domain
MKFFALILIFAVAAAGCTTRSKANAEARAAFLVGQNTAMQQQLQVQSVTIIGPVQNPQVPWVAGLTLAQAIATANYLDSHEPRQIIITRQGESARLDPKVLLRGHDVPLEPGDVIEIQPH